MDKRQRERVRKQKQMDKERRRIERTADRAADRRERSINGSEDPDLEGIVPGPQPGQIIDLS